MCFLVVANLSESLIQQTKDEQLFFITIQVERADDFSCVPYRPAYVVTGPQVRESRFDVAETRHNLQRAFWWSPLCHLCLFMLTSNTICREYPMRYCQLNEKLLIDTSLCGNMKVFIWQQYRGFWHQKSTLVLFRLHICPSFWIKLAMPYFTVSSLLGHLQICLPSSLSAERACCTQAQTNLEQQRPRCPFHKFAA